MMHTLSVLAALTAALVALAGCGKSETPASAPKPDATSGSGRQPVQIQQVQRQFLTVEAVGAASAAERLLLPGRVAFRPQAQSAIGATTAGRVIALHVRAGEVVKAGAPLLTIDSADASAARASLEQSATRLASAEHAHRRQVEMVEKGVGLELERQEAEARLKEARAEQERARQTVALIGGGAGSKVVVRAPASGVVTNIRVAVGATVAPGGESLIELGDPHQLQVVALVPESDLRRIAIGQQAEVDLPALSARGAARVENINPRVEAESRRAQVYLALTGKIEGMQAGMIAQIALRAAGESGITVPTSAVLIKEGKRRVVYVERPDGAFELREVRTGRNQDGRVVVLEGLTAGEKIVVRGALLLDTQAEQLL